MTSESEFAQKLQILLRQDLEHAQPALKLIAHRALFYEIALSNTLSLTETPSSPKRGQSAFQTDLCAFDSENALGASVELPRVVLELKDGLSTHDILVYSTKARRHKQVYPWLRYGIAAAGEPHITQKFFVHNEGIDFYLAVRDLESNTLHDMLLELIRDEVEASRLLEKLAFGPTNSRLFRNKLCLEAVAGPTLAAGRTTT